VSAKRKLQQALHTPSVQSALSAFVGIPEGGWGETKQAKARLVEALPRPEDRDYTLADVIDAALCVCPTTGRYQRMERAS